MEKFSLAEVEPNAFEKRMEMRQQEARERIFAATNKKMQALENKEELLSAKKQNFYSALKSSSR